MIRIYNPRLTLSSLLLLCQIVVAVPEDTKNLLESVNVHSNVKLGKGLIESCDKIVIYHALYGEVAFEGNRLRSLVDRLEKCMHDEWWCDEFSTKGREAWRVMIEFSVKTKKDPSKYVIIALFPLHHQMCKPEELGVLESLLKETFPNKSDP